MAGSARTGGRHELLAGDDRLFDITGQVFKDLLLALLEFEENGFRQASIIASRVGLARRRQDSPQVIDALLSNQHLIVGLNHLISSYTIPRFRKSRVV